MPDTYHFMPRPLCADVAREDEHTLAGEPRRQCMARRSAVDHDAELHEQLSQDPNVRGVVGVRWAFLLVLLCGLCRSLRFFLAFRRLGKQNQCATTHRAFFAVCCLRSYCLPLCRLHGAWPYSVSPPEDTVCSLCSKNRPSNIPTPKCALCAGGVGVTAGRPQARAEVSSNPRGAKKREGAREPTDG